MDSGSFEGKRVDQFKLKSNTGVEVDPDFLGCECARLARAGRR